MIEARLVNIICFQFTIYLEHSTTDATKNVIAIPPHFPLIWAADIYSTATGQSQHVHITSLQSRVVSFGILSHINSIDPMKLFFSIMHVSGLKISNDNI
jgi:hypothetical protein